jgi:hypothetical protein
MNEILKLAEAYYTVARDLNARAASMYRMGENLFQIADNLCEQNAKETQNPVTAPPAPAPSPPVR